MDIDINYLVSGLPDVQNVLHFMSSLQLNISFRQSVILLFIITIIIIIIVVNNTLLTVTGSQSRPVHRASRCTAGTEEDH